MRRRDIHNPPPVTPGGPQREEMGRDLAANVRIDMWNGAYLVPSTTNAQPRKYVVDLRGRYPVCSCPDYEDRLVQCKHIIAAQELQKEEQDVDARTRVPAPTHVVKMKSGRIRDTYKQDWKNYNAAQTNETDLVKKLLFSLLERVVEEPPRTGLKGGRPRACKRDVIFAMAYKVYRTVSSRRMISDLRGAFADGFLTQPMHFNTLLKYFEDPEMYPVLQRLVRISAFPLRHVESVFAIDGTGFSRNQYLRWLDSREGRYKSEKTWMKGHIAIGVKTNVITAAEVTRGNANDSPWMPMLVEATSQNFDMKEVCADKGYSSRANHDFVASHGATPYIAFKQNATGASDDTFGKMFTFSTLYREEYLDHYHQRSNVESTMAMVKKKFGTFVHSNTEVSSKNEIMCKFLCHNLCCLVHAMYELGIDPSFRVPPGMDAAKRA